VAAASKGKSKRAYAIVLAAIALQLLGFSGSARSADLELAQRNSSKSLFPANCPRPEDGRCFQWGIRSPTFSPDSRYLFFSYYYFSDRLRNNKITLPIIARINLSDFSARRYRISCDISLDYPAVSPNGKQLAFRADMPIARKGGRSSSARGRSRETRIGIMNLDGSGVHIFPDRWVKHTYQPFFSRDGRYLYFLEQDLIRTLISAIDLRTMSYVDFYTKASASVADRNSAAVLLVRFLGNPAMNASGDSFLFRGRPQGKQKEILRQLSNRIGKPVLRLATLDYVFRFYIRDKRIVLHEINDNVKYNKRIFQFSNAFQTIQVMNNGDIFYSRSNLLGNPNKPQHIFLYRDRVLTAFLRIEKNLHLGLSSYAVYFAISPDRKWAAYTFTRWPDPSRPIWFDVLVLKNIETGKRREINLGDVVYRRLAAGGCSRRKISQ